MAINEYKGDRPPPYRPWLTTPGIPWYRDLRIRRAIWQVVFVVVLAIVLLMGISNLVTNLRESNFPLNFQIYKTPFTIAEPEGISFNSEWTWVKDPDLTGSGSWYGWLKIWELPASLAWYVWVVIWLRTMWWVAKPYWKRQRVMAISIGIGMIIALLLQPIVFRWAVLGVEDYLAAGTKTRAMITGIVNTLRVVFFTLIASTLLGVLAGIGLLSRNFLLRTISRVYVEIFRNTPLLVQLLFIHRIILLFVPAPRTPFTSPDSILGFKLHEELFMIQSRAFIFAVPRHNDSAIYFYGAIAVGIGVAWLVRRWRLKQQEETGQPANTWYYLIPLLVASVIIGWFLAGGEPIGEGPFTMDYPHQRGLSFEGGTSLTEPFMALFLGLTLYTAAFIADIVRAGIQSVPYGQIEAARAHGLSNTQVLNLVVLPQALRLIIPPLGNQYVNMGKNSSLGLAVAYVDTYRVIQLANNESGQAVPFFTGLMIAYLLLSLTLSLFTNILNNATRIKVR